jgi:1,4-dihydroxy-2-naphthoate octaprenyltransferase
MPQTKPYQKLTPTAILELIAPQTWIAALAPVVVGLALAIGVGGLTPQAILTQPLLLLKALLMLLTACAAQAATNTLNDYADFKAGTDTEANCVDETDQAIIYHHLNPRDARTVALVCLAVALFCGLTLVMLTSWLILVLGLVGLAAVVAYSAGPKPISYLPLGELVSGTVMGIVITLATYLSLTGQFSVLALLGCVPPFVSIALIMQTNNTADIERDIIAGRRTLPIYLGERRSAALIAGANGATLVFELLFCLSRFRFGAPLIVAAGCFSYANIRLLAAGPYNAELRPRLMKASVQQAAIINFLFALAILLGAHFNV